MKFRVNTTLPLVATGAVALAMMASTPAWAGGAKLCWEAEAASSLESPLRKELKGVSAQYSGKGYLEIPWDQNKTKGVGEAVYNIKADAPGTYFVWARTFWANGCGNSIALTVNDSEPKIVGEDGTYDKWHWVGGRTRVTLKAGVNKIVLKNKETGIRVDQFFFCQDPEYTPVNTRKVNR